MIVCAELPLLISICNLFLQCSFSYSTPSIEWLLPEETENRLNIIMIPITKRGEIYYYLPINLFVRPDPAEDFDDLKPEKVRKYKGKIGGV